MRQFGVRVALLFISALFFGLASDTADAQPSFGPSSPLTQIGVDPNWGPICAGFPEPGFGSAPCNIVQNEIQLRQKIGPIAATLQQIGFDQSVGPICQGPLGPGPCLMVARWLATQQMAQQNAPQLQQIGFVPGVGPICNGPLGPGPCEAIRQFLGQQQLGLLPNNIELNQVRPTAGRDGSGGPLCTGALGTLPCAMYGQTRLDGIHDQAIPSQSSLGLPQISDSRALAVECARRSALDIATFVGCTNQQVILPRKSQDLLDCTVSNQNVLEFAKCAAAATGIALSDGQRIIANCAISSQGQAASFASCASRIGNLRSVISADAERAILNCAATPGISSSTFTDCASSQFMNLQQRAVVNCTMSAPDAASFAECAAPNLGVKMSDEQRIAIRCAQRSGGDQDAFIGCAGSALVGRTLGPEATAAIRCAANARGDSTAFAVCAAGQLPGGQLSREQSIALRCAVESGADPISFGGCAAANMFSLQLNPEQQIAIQCVMSAGGAPPAAAGCIASRLTLRELSKCMSDGFGGDGCFGDNNDLIGKNGFVARTMGQIVGGPNSLIRNPGQIWGGDNSFVRNPGQVWGGPNSFVRNPSQIWGGQNSVFNKPSQLVPPPPPPVQLGTIGGKRICLPWC